MEPFRFKLKHLGALRAESIVRFRYYTMPAKLLSFKYQQGDSPFAWTTTGGLDAATPQTVTLAVRKPLYKYVILLDIRPTTRR